MDKSIAWFTNSKKYYCKSLQKSHILKHYNENNFVRAFVQYIIPVDLYHASVLKSALFYFDYFYCLLNSKAHLSTNHIFWLLIRTFEIIQFFHYHLAILFPTLLIWGRMWKGVKEEVGYWDASAYQNNASKTKESLICFWRGK